MLNRVILVGRLATDPELKYTPSGVAVANFRVAVDRSFTNSQGEKETDFFSVVTWRQSAEFCANYLTKGRLVAIDGRLQARSWQTQDGQRRTVVEVVADHVRGLDRPKEGAPAPGGHAGSEDAGAPAPGPAEDDFGPDPFADQ